MTKYVSLPSKFGKLNYGLISLALVFGFFFLPPFYVWASNELVLAWHEHKLNRDHVPDTAKEFAAWWMDRAFYEIVTTKKTSRSELTRKALGVSPSCDLKYLDVKVSAPDRVRKFGDQTYIHMYGRLFDMCSPNLNLIRFKAELMVDNKKGKLSISSVKIRKLDSLSSKQFFESVSKPSSTKFLEQNRKILKQLRYNNAWNEIDKKRALEELNRALLLNNRCAYLHYLRAYHMYDEGKFEEALKEYEISAKLESKNITDALVNGAGIKGSLGDYEGALKDLDLAIKVNPDNYFAYGIRAYENNSHEKYEEALRDYSMAIELDPGQYDYYCNRAMVYEKLGRNYFALVDYTQMISLEPKNYKGYYYRGLLLMNMKLYAEALPDLDLTLKLRPEGEKKDDFWIYHQRSIANSQAQHLSESISDATKVIQLRPELPYGYWDRAFPGMKLGYKREALLDFAKGTALQPDNARAYFAMGRLQRSAGEFSEALKSFNKAIELEKFSEAFSERAAVKGLLNDEYGARQDLVEAERWRLHP
ncbi:MAG: tetratricopeptide repeat protein [Candidatus Melainabacteria bacterium]|nr:tetratricopeptide repeat protein [Candidatus Melainabacteria bacterium]